MAPLFCGNAVYGHGFTPATSRVLGISDIFAHAAIDRIDQRISDQNLRTIATLRARRHAGSTSRGFVSARSAAARGLRSRTRLSVHGGCRSVSPLTGLSTAFKSYSQKVTRYGLTRRCDGDTIAAVMLMNRHYGAVSNDPVRNGPLINIRSLKTEQYSSA